MAAIFGLTIILFVLGIIESRTHNRNLNRIAVRIHVNGTRGKSMITRFIAGGLREAGFRVLAKTTGSSARLILEDGTEIPVKRRGYPMIIEQVRVMSLARKRDIDVLVMECMAIRPEIQWIAEHRLVRSTIGVITNVRLDHSDHMGLDLDDVANTLSLSIPDSGMLVTTQHRFVPKFKTIAEKQGTSIFIVNNHDISDKEFSQFDRPVFRENLAVALKVCSLLGVSRKTALRGMRNARADPGAMKVFRLRHGKSTIFFVNAFAANDPESTMMVWELWKNRRSYEYIKNLPVVGILNNRMDRGFRLKDLSQAFINKIQLEHIMLTGQSVFLARRFLIRAGVEPSRISVYGGFFGSKVLVAKLIDDINKMDRNDVVLLGFGNMKGPGQQIVDYFQKTGVELL